MANMFSNNTEKRVPKKFKDCTQPDDVSTNLWIWAERLERIGKILFVLIILAGIFFTIDAAAKASEMIDAVGANTIEEIRAASAQYGIEIPTLYEAIIDSLLRWAFYAFLEYCLYHAIALLIGALATITQNSAVSANVALYTAWKNEVTTIKEQAESAKKVENVSAAASENTVETPKPSVVKSARTVAQTVTCPKCGKTQFGNRKTCWSCGAQMKEN